MTPKRLVPAAKKKPLRRSAGATGHTDKQKRQAAHIEEGYEKKGVKVRRAKSIAWATVNKLSGNGTKASRKVAQAR